MDLKQNDLEKGLEPTNLNQNSTDNYLKLNNSLELEKPHKGLTKEFKTYLKYSILFMTIFYTSIILAIKVYNAFMLGCIVWLLYLGYSYLFEETTKFIMN